MKEGLGLAVNKADVNFMVNVLPFLGGTKRYKQLLKCALMVWAVLEPGQKIERLGLCQISAVM